MENQNTKKSDQDPDSVKLDDFMMISLIGKGTYAKVCLVEKMNEKGRLYALKILDKKRILKAKEKRHVMNEREVLMQANHPFIIKFYYSF